MNAPRRLVRITLSNASTSRLAIGTFGMMPALLTTTSMRPKTFLRGVEHACHVGGFGDIALDRKRAAARGFDLGDEGVGELRVARVVGDDRKAVARETKRDRATDAARGAGDDCGTGISLHRNLFRAVDDSGGRHARESGHPRSRRKWIPACAGMTPFYSSAVTSPCIAAVDRKIRARDPARTIVDEETHRVRNLVGLAEPADRKSAP